MMNFTLRSRKTVTYESVGWHDSRTLPGVRFAVRKISLADRLALIRRIRELCARQEFLSAGDTSEQGAARVNELLIEKMYLEWGLTAIRGLTIDGAAATVESVVQDGPESLADEIIEQIRTSLGLTEEERKNS